MYTEGVISKEMLNEVQSAGGCLNDNLLRALQSTIYLYHDKLKIFGTILLRSKKTVKLATDILGIIYYNTNFTIM